jgi:hypothetical protein
MRKQLVALAIASTAVAGLFAAPSAEAQVTTTTFVLSAAGGLSVTAPETKELSAGTATNAGTLTAQLGATQVSDQRGSLLGSWTASVTSTDFTTGAASADETIAKANVSYWSGAATASSGTAVFVPGQLLVANAQALSAGRTAFSATGTVGNNTATWNPTVVVTIPAQAVTGTYSGTITHSIA